MIDDRFVAASADTDFSSSLLSSGCADALDTQLVLSLAGLDDSVTVESWAAFGDGAEADQSRLPTLQASWKEPLPPQGAVVAELELHATGAVSLRPAGVQYRAHNAMAPDQPLIFTGTSNELPTMTLGGHFEL